MKLYVVLFWITTFVWIITFPQERKDNLEIIKRSSDIRLKQDSIKTNINYKIDSIKISIKKINNSSDVIAKNEGYIHNLQIKRKKLENKKYISKDSVYIDSVCVKSSSWFGRTFFGKNDCKIYIEEENIFNDSIIVDSLNLNK